MFKMCVARVSWNPPRVLEVFEIIQCSVWLARAPLYRERESGHISRSLLPANKNVAADERAPQRPSPHPQRIRRSWPWSSTEDPSSMGQPKKRR
jgi:hypothetical protein